ncbi:hypothetical protein [Salmonella enterica]|uniref:hypothetical protein n=1 Tax=Salmonella enterica TaxID=28901 RepID=UPI0034E5C1E6
MKTLDVISTQLNFNNLLNQAGYNLSEIVVKRYSAAPAFNEGHWLFIAEQDNRYIEVVSLLSKASESGEQHVDIGSDSNLLIVFYVQIMPDDLVMQLHRF